MTPAARRLFFLYAHPCTEVLVSMRKHTRKQMLGIRKAALRKDYSTSAFFFPTASREIAKLAGNKKVDARLVRRYFLEEHDRIVRERGADWRVCVVWPAKVIATNGSNARVRTPLGEKNVNIDFCPCKKGDLVTVHYNHACEQITSREFERLNKRKLVK